MLDNNVILAKVLPIEAITEVLYCCHTNIVQEIHLLFLEHLLGNTCFRCILKTALKTCNNSARVCGNYTLKSFLVKRFSWSRTII